MVQSQSLGISTRIGGAFLFLAGIAMPIIIVDYVLTMSAMSGTDGAPTLAERATFAAGVYDHLAVGWHAEVIAMALLGAGSIALADRESRSGWALAAMGVVVAMPMYAVMVGGYGAVLSETEVDLRLFAALDAIAAFCFFIGQGLLHLGLATAFAIEARKDLPLLPAWFFILGAGANLVTGAVFTMVHLGILDGFMIAGPFGLTSYALLAILGVRLMRGTAEPQARRTESKAG